MESESIQSLDSFKDISLLTLGRPNALPGGGSYYAKLLYNNKPIDIQVSPCLTKQGVVSTGTKTYCDLMYDNKEVIEPSLMQILEQIEEKCIQLIFEKKDTWFSSNLELSDIETAFSSCMRLYKSGKFTLVRTNIPNSKKMIKDISQTCEVYNQRGENLTLDTITSDVKIIPLIRIDELRFSSKSFHINVLLNQCLVLDKQEENKKGCRIKLDSSLNQNDNNNKYNFENNEIKLETNKIKVENKKEEFITQTESNDNKNKHDLIKKDDNSKTLLNSSILTKKEVIKPKLSLSPSSQKITKQTENELEEVDIKANSDSDSDSDSELNEDDDELEECEIKVESDNENEDEDNLEEDEEFDGMKVVKTIKVDKNDKSSLLKLKKPDEVYYELYKSAKEKAKKARKEAITLFLEAKSIKAKYMLDEIDESDDEEFYSNL